MLGATTPLTCASLDLDTRGLFDHNCRLEDSENIRDDIWDVGDKL